MDDSSNQALRDLGIFYCTVFVVFLAACSLALWLYWDAWRLDNLIPMISNVSGASIGTALLATILKEGAWDMVLAAMIKKKWRQEAIAEGREQGREEERERQRKREDAAYARFGVEVDGVLMLPRTPEVERFLAGQPEE